MNTLAKQHSREGAIEFAPYYVQALNWSLATTNPYLLKRISAATCHTCQGYVKLLDELAAKGGHVEGGKIDLHSVQVVYAQGDIKSDYVIAISYTQAPLTRVYPSAPPSTDSTKELPYTSHLFVSWVGNAWQVLEEEASS